MSFGRCKRNGWFRVSLVSVWITGEFGLSEAKLNCLGIFISFFERVPQLGTLESINVYRKN